MKVFQDYKSKLDSTEKHDSNFGYVCIKKADRSKKRGLYFFLGVLNPEPPVRTPLSATTKVCLKICQQKFPQISPEEQHFFEHLENSLN